MRSPTACLLARPPTTWPLTLRSAPAAARASLPPTAPSLTALTATTLTLTTLALTTPTLAALTATTPTLTALTLTTTTSLTPGASALPPSAPTGCLELGLGHGAVAVLVSGTESRPPRPWDFVFGDHAVLVLVQGDKSATARSAPARALRGEIGDDDGTGQQSC